MRLLYLLRALWWKVSKARPVQAVIVRDPSGHEKDDYFFTTDLSMDPAHLVEVHSARLGVEEAIRDGKQVVGMDDVQDYRATAVERQAPFAMVIFWLVKVWYLKHVAPRERPDALPGTASMLARLRMAFWQRRISDISAPRRETRKLAEALGAVLAAASWVPKSTLSDMDLEGVDGAGAAAGVGPRRSSRDEVQEVPELHDARAVPGVRGARRIMMRVLR